MLSFGLGFSSGGIFSCSKASVMTGKGFVATGVYTSGLVVETTFSVVMHPENNTKNSTINVIYLSDILITSLWLLIVDYCHINIISRYYLFNVFATSFAKYVSIISAPARF